MKLSILVCTVVERCDTFAPLILKQLKMQKSKYKDVELLYLGDDCDMTTGEKRNKLIEIARGDYVVFVDDDDRISTDYVASLIDAVTTTDSDVICFNAYYSENGGIQKPVWYSVEYDNDQDLKDGFRRIPNHLMCIKRDICLKVRYKPVTKGEDSDFSKRVKPYLKSQTLLDKYLYFYDFNTNTTIGQR